MKKYYNTQQEEKEEYQYPEYTNTELWALNNLLKEKYNDGNKIDDITKWLTDEGALNEYGAVIYKEHPAKYAILQDKLSKANKLMGRKEFAVKKELEDLAKNMTLESDILPDNF